MGNGKSPGPGDNSGSISAERLQSIVNRIERLEEERKALTADIADIYKEAKSAGYDVKVLRQVIRMRKMDASDLAEEQALVDTYMHALGM